MRKTTYPLPSQAIILAAGGGSRFVPFNDRKTHKSTMPLMGEPMIVQTVAALQRAGVKEVIVVKSGSDTSIETVLSNVDQTKIRIIFCEQNQPLGMANALLAVKDKLQKKFLVVNPQQINIDRHLSLLANLNQVDAGCPVILFSQKTGDPQKYGMLGLDGNRVRQVVEKPGSSEGLSDQRILGIYLLDLDFLALMETLATTEYQFEEALNQYAQKEKIVAVSSNRPAISLKYAWDLFAVVQHKFGEIPEEGRVDPRAQIHPTALISGPVIIEEGARIFEYAIIAGPAFIGKNSIVGSYCKVRKESVLEEGVELQNNVEVKHSIIGRGSHIHSGFVGDSIIGEEVRIGAGFITANRRLDRKSVRVLIKGQVVDTKNSFFGCLIGDRAKIGIHCGTNPGAIILADSVVKPMTMIQSG